MCVVHNIEVELSAFRMVAVVLHFNRLSVLRCDKRPKMNVMQDGNKIVKFIYLMDVCVCVCVWHIVDLVDVQILANLFQLRSHSLMCINVSNIRIFRAQSSLNNQNLKRHDG